MTITLERTDQAVRDVVTARSRAMSAQDADAVGACQAADFVCYSLAPPLVADGGPEGFRAWLSSWEGPFVYEVRDLAVTASDSVAFAHGLANMRGRKVGGPQISLWFRLSLGLRRTKTGWKITHEHDSVPFNMDGSFRAAIELEP
jgi:ketosteroid isomerase-like protein